MFPHDYAKIYESQNINTSKLNADLEETTNRIELEKEKQLQNEEIHNEVNALI